MAGLKLHGRWKDIFRTSVSCLCLSTYVGQCILLARYLMMFSRMWYLWTIADVLVLVLLFVTCVTAHRHWLRTRGRRNARSPPEKLLPLGYISWGFYSAVLASKLSVLFLHVAYKLNEQSDFGPNALKTAISLSSIIFLLLVITQTNEEISTPDHLLYINKLIGSVSIDILDTVNFIEVLFIQESRVFMTFAMHHAIVATACINVVLPTLPLLLLQHTRGGHNPMSMLLTTLHIACYLLLVNVPMLVMRLLFWHLHKQDVSVFLIKNVVHIGMMVKLIYSNTQELIDDHHEEEDEAGEGVELRQMPPPLPRNA